MIQYSPELEQKFQRLVAQYPWKRSALIPMLLYAQDEVGYLSEEVVADIAKRVELTELEVQTLAGAPKTVPRARTRRA